MKQFSRSDRLGGQILKDTSEYMDRVLAEKIEGMITFTYARLSKDLQYVTLYYSFLGNDEKRKSSQNFLDARKKEIRKHVGQFIRARHIPEFTFKFDPSIEEGQKIERLLNEIADERK